MLKETKTEETIGFIAIIFIVRSILVWEGPGPHPSWLSLCYEVGCYEQKLKT